jgi:hypothetical protein
MPSKSTEQFKIRELTKWNDLHIMHSFMYIVHRTHKSTKTETMPILTDMEKSMRGTYEKNQKKKYFQLGISWNEKTERL